MFSTLNETQSKRLFQAVYMLLVIGSLYLLSRVITEVKTSANIGHTPVQSQISVTGNGDAYAIPDIASVSYDVSFEAKTVTEAQTNVTQRANDILAYLKTAGIKEVDVKTTNYQIYPHYEYNNRPVVCYDAASCQAKDNRVFIGYNVTSSFLVKIRKVEDAGKILAEIGNRKVSNLSGLSFTVEDDNAVKALARKNAIEDAQRKAKVLAKDLGVSLGKINSFSESGSGYYPMYYSKTMSMDSAAGMAAPTPELPAGENKTSTQVTITYEID
ncbi:MAG: SIMPL domain-containing protein [bacterium]